MATTIGQMIIRDCFDPAEPNDLEAIERDLGTALPHEYRRYLMKVNGGVLRPPHEVLAHFSEWMVLRYLCGVQLGTDGSGLDAMKWRRDLCDLLPETLFPVSDVEATLIIVLGLNGSQRGRVGVWRGNNKPEGETQWFADSFDGFLARLRPVPRLGARYSEEPFHACEWGDMHMLKSYLDNGIDPDLFHADGNTLAMIAARAGIVEALECIIQHGARLSLRRIDGSQVIHMAVRGRSLDCVLASIQMGAEVDSEDESGQTPLILAAKLGETRIVRCLLQHGADGTRRDTDGRTPLRIALDAGNTAVQEVLR